MPLGWENNTKYMAESARLEGRSMSFGWKSKDTPPSTLRYGLH